MSADLVVRRAFAEGTGSADLSPAGQHRKALVAIPDASKWKVSLGCSCLGRFVVSGITAGNRGREKMAMIQSQWVKQEEV